MKIIKRSDNSSLTPFSPMRSLFDDFFSTSSLMDDMLNTNYYSKNLFADVWEEDDSYFVKMAMPGVNKDSIEISTTADSITIKGSSSDKEEKEKEGKKYYCKTMEASYEQTFNLPNRVDSDAAEASYEDGVLTVKLPKAEDLKPKKIEIK